MIANYIQDMSNEDEAKKKTFKRNKNLSKVQVLALITYVYIICMYIRT